MILRGALGKQDSLGSESGGTVTMDWSMGSWMRWAGGSMLRERCCLFRLAGAAEGAAALGLAGVGAGAAAAAACMKRGASAGSPAAERVLRQPGT